MEPHIFGIACEDFLHEPMQVMCRGAYQYPVAYVVFVLFVISPLIVAAIFGYIANKDFKNR